MSDTFFDRQNERCSCKGCGAIGAYTEQEDLCQECKDERNKDQLVKRLQREITELRQHLVWALSSPRCTCYDPDCRWQSDKCSCGHDDRRRAALKAAKGGKP